MLDKEVIEITKGLVHRVTALQWVVGVEAPVVVSMMFGFAALMVKFFKDFRRGAIESFRKHTDEIRRDFGRIERDVEDIKTTVDGLNECREENAGNIIALKHDLEAQKQLNAAEHAAIVKVCEEKCK